MWLSDTIENFRKISKWLDSDESNGWSDAQGYCLEGHAYLSDISIPVKEKPACRRSVIPRTPTDIKIEIALPHVRMLQAALEHRDRVTAKKACAAVLAYLA